MLDSIHFPNTKTLFYCKKSRLGKSKVFKLNTSTLKTEEFCSCYLPPWLSSCLKQNKLKTDLIIQVSFNKIKVLFNVETCSKSINLQSLSMTIPKGNIESFHPFSEDKILITSKEGHIYFLQYNKYSGKTAVLGHKWLRCMISSASICHKGQHLAVSTSDQFGKLDKLLIWRISNSFDFVLPRVVDFKTSKFSKKDHSGLNDLKLGYIADKLIVIGLQLLGDRTLFTYVAEETKMLPLTIKENFIEGPFHLFGIYKETMWVINPSGSILELVFDIE